MQQTRPKKYQKLLKNFKEKHSMLHTRSISINPISNQQQFRIKTQFFFIFISLTSQFSRKPQPICFIFDSPLTTIKQNPLPILIQNPIFSPIWAQKHQIPHNKTEKPNKIQQIRSDLHVINLNFTGKLNQPPSP